MTDTALTRLIRVVPIFCVTCIYLYLLAFTPLIVESFRLIPMWAACTVVTVVGTTAAMIYCLVTGHRHGLKVASFGLFFSHQAATALWWILAPEVLPEDFERPWHYEFIAMPIIAILPYISSWVAAATVPAVVLFTKLVVMPPDVGEFLSDVMHSMALAGFSVLVATTLLQVARRSDELSNAAEESTAAAAAAEHEAIERERVDGLIHDSVMSTLITAARSNIAPSVRESAELTLSELQAMRLDQGSSADVSAPTFLGLFRSSLHFVDPTLRITVAEGSADVPGAIPVEVARSVISAATEALKNSLRHAGQCTRSASIALTLAHGDDLSPHISATVADDGRGFDPQRVKPTRLGIRSSIVGRMDLLDGGRTVLDSAVGKGTRVTVEWTPS